MNDAGVFWMLYAIYLVLLAGETDSEFGRAVITLSAIVMSGVALYVKLLG